MAVLTGKRRSTGKRLAGCLAGAMVAFGLSAAAAAPAGIPLEYAVKANFLYKFGPFVEWPPKVFASPTAPFIVCVLGEDPFGRTLDDAVRGQSVNGRPSGIRRIAWASRTSGCHVLYLGRSGRQSQSEALEAVRGAPILTVTDERTGGGGVINFVVVQGRVRFAVDVDRARTNGLALSSKLLALAVTTRQSEGS